MTTQRDSQQPINLADMKFIEVESISVNEWHRLPNGQGKPEQVHLWIKLSDAPATMVLRFRSPKAVDNLIVALMTHRKSVWPKARP